MDAATVLALVVCGIAGVAFTIHIVAVLASFAYYKDTAALPKTLLAADRRAQLPPVSIVKPLKGADGLLYENLESFFVLDYPTYEVLFCVGDEDDAALQVVEQLATRYPRVDIRLFTRETHIGNNPKLCNIYRAYTEAKYDLVWISDAGLKARPGTLAVNVAAHQASPKVGLVHQLPTIAHATGIGGLLEAIYFATMHARVYLFVNLFGVNCANGMSFLLRRSLLDSLGGLRHFAQYIAEDFFIGEAIVASGHTIRLSHEPAFQNFGERPLDTFFFRQIRWTRLRKTMMPFQTPLEPLLQCFPLSLLFAWAVWFLGVSAVSPLSCVASFIALWCALDMILIWRLDSFSRYVFSSSGAPYALALWVVCELVELPLFVCAMLGNTIAWRNRAFVVERGGRGVPIGDAVSGATHRFVYTALRMLTDLVVFVSVSVAYIVHRSTRNGKESESDEKLARSGLSPTESTSFVRDVALAAAAVGVVATLTLWQYGAATT